MAIIVRSIGKALPQRKVHNDELPAELETSNEWIVSHTGIENRYISNDSETSETLGAAACNQALEMAGIKADEIGLLVVSTVTPIYCGFPSNACLIQDRIGAKNASCFDTIAACSGFIYALNNASALMEYNNVKYALVCSTETLTKIADWHDRSTCVLFGDAAGAVLLEKVEDCGETRIGVGSFVSGADGSGAKALYLGEDGFLKMDGHKVYDFAVSSMTNIIQQVMKNEGLAEADVDYFVCHQANERILRASAKRLGFGYEKFIRSMNEYGNTSSASIPITLADMQNQGLIKEGTTIVMAAFGAGLTWAGTVIRF